MQMLHINEQCGREVSEALVNCEGKDDTFAMLSVLIEVGDYNEEFEPIIKGKI